MRAAVPGLRRYAATLAVVAAASGCAGGDGGTGGGSEGGTVTVLAAASLTEPLTALARAYEDDHPGTTVRLSFGSSTTLAQQVAEGAPADLLALAGTAALAFLPEEPRTTAPRQAVIARNTLAIATPPGNPAGVTGLADLARADVDVVLCVATVPCGQAADEVLARARTSAHVVSREIDVRATLAKVRLGEADAAVVYRSDLTSARGAVAGVEIPEAQNTTLEYPMRWFNDRTATVRFADLVAGEEGRAALTAAGFLAP